MEKELSSCRVWLYARIPGDYVGTMDSIKVCALQAHADGCTVVGSSTDEHGGWLLRPGYREMLRHIRKGEIDTVYICRIGYALVVLFFAISLCKNTMNFHELKRPEAAIHYFLRFVAAKALVGYGMDIMLNVFSICNGIVTDMADSMGGISEAMVSLPAEMQTAIENVGFLASIPLWLVTILGSLFITVLSFVMILTVYGRFFRLYMYTALAPLPLAAFAGESTQSVGISFLKSYVGVCLEGAVIVLACVIYSAFVSTPTVTSGEATTIVWSFLAETVFNMLVLVGLIKGSDRIIHEMMGL